MTFARPALKALAERLGVAVGRTLRGRLRGRSLILAYHNVVPDDTPPVGDLPNHLPLSHFRRQLDTLTRLVDVVPLEDALAVRPGAPPRVAITFDDAYVGAVTIGWPEVERRGLPATCFLNPGFIGGEAFWWDELAGPDGLPPAIRRHVLSELAGDTEAARVWAASADQARRTDLPAVCTVVTETQLHRAAGAGLRIGSHTWGHLNLTVVDPDRVAARLVEARRWIEARFSRAAFDGLAYPYGLWSPAVADATRAAGHRFGLAASGGWFDPARVDPYALPRVSIPAGLSDAGFALRVLGLVG